MGPVLFLDIDGVLNSAAWMRAGHMKAGASLEALDPAACARLHRILVATGCAVVLSSSWRYNVKAGELRAWLALRGCPDAPIIGRTPLGSEMPAAADWTGAAKLLHGHARGYEIQAWIDMQAPPRRPTRIAIVDDSEDMAHLQARLVRTSWDDGLQDGHAERLIAKLGRVSPPTAAPTLDTDKMPGED